MMAFFLIAATKPTYVAVFAMVKAMDKKLTDNLVYFFS